MNGVGRLQKWVSRAHYGSLKQDVPVQGPRSEKQAIGYQVGQVPVMIRTFCRILLFWSLVHQPLDWLGKDLNNG